MRFPVQGWMDSGRPQWQLQLSLPAHLRGQTIGLKVIGQPLARTSQMALGEKEAGALSALVYYGFSAQTKEERLKDPPWLNIGRALACRPGSD